MVKNLSANARDIKDTGSIPGLGRSLGIPTPVFLPRIHGQRRQSGYSPEGNKESDTTRAT